MGRGRRSASAKKSLGVLAEAQPEQIVGGDTASSDRTLRNGIASFYKRHLESEVNQRYPLPASRLAVEQPFTAEQVWGQLSVLYAPVLKRAGTTVDRLTKTAASTAKEPSSKMQRETNASRQVPVAGLDDDDDESELLTSDDDSQVDAVHSMLQATRSHKAKRRGGGGAEADPDAWRYALGRGGEDEEDEEDEEDGAADPDDKHAALDTADADEDEEFDLGMDEEEGEDGGGDDDEEDADEEDVSSDAAMKEIYGSDYEDDDEDEEEEDELFDQDFQSYARAREAEDGEEEEEGDGDDAAEGEEAEGDDEDGPAVAASPFGPNAAPENPLDFTQIDNDPSLTAFEKAERKRLLETKERELERVHGAHWTMKGEIAAAARPRDSLIDETLDFDHALRPAPLITEHFTIKLEDRIKKRIVDNNFDDVQRRAPATTPGDLDSSNRRDAALDAKKSKESLMDLYEKQFLEKKAAAEAAEGLASGPTAEALSEVERDELQAVQMWKRLSQHFDALSNFYFTPKPVNPEVDARVRATQNQAPAVTLEAVGLSALAKDAVLAPQDVFRPQRHRLADVSGTELEPKERRAIRRAAKASSKASTDRKSKQDIVRGKKEPSSTGGTKRKPTSSGGGKAVPAA